MKYVLIALLLTGCATIESVRTEGTHTEHALRQSPNDAAVCIARNIEKIWPVMVTQVRAAGSESEMIARSAPEKVFAVSQVAPTKTGSIAQLWITPHWIGGNNDYVAAMVKGC